MQSFTCMSQIVLPQHTNAVGTLFGGVLMSWVDICAAIAAEKHSKHAVVTASMDQLDFDLPIHLGDVVTLKAMVNFTGRTSMEVGVRIDKEFPRSDLPRVKAAAAYLTFVAID